MLSLIIEKGLVKSNLEKMNLIVTLMDKPGALMHLTKFLQKFNKYSSNRL